jgi:hypothetical protein
MDALIKKSRETELIRVAEPNAAAEDAGDQFSFQSPRTRRRRWTIRRSTRLFSRPRTASMASMVRQSVAARKHVFCERPLALTRRIAEWFGVEWVMAADEMAPLGNADGKAVEVWKGMADEYGLGTDLWRPASPRLTDLGSSRPIEVATDMALQPGAGLSCVPEHGAPFLDLFSGLRADGIIP